MGYYTEYTLSVSNGSNGLIDEFREESEDAKYAIDSNGDPNQVCKWYECEDELKVFSKKHPEVLFTLNGVGEESGDIWASYIKNGKIQKCKAQIVIPDFDESLLV